MEFGLNEGRVASRWPGWDEAQAQAQTQAQTQGTDPDTDPGTDPGQTQAQTQAQAQAQTEAQDAFDADRGSEISPAARSSARIA